MGKLNKVVMFLLTIYFIFFCLVCCKSSSADASRPRLLLNDLNPRNLAATELAFDFDVPVKDKIGVGSVHVGPCEMERTAGKLGGIYGSLVLNALPKGRTPASGPSRRTNDINI